MNNESVTSGVWDFLFVYKKGSFFFFQQKHHLWFKNLHYE